MSPQRPDGHTVWLASYPKSGNTWVRAIVTALGVGEHLFDVNHLGSGAQPFTVLGAIPHLGLDPRWLSRPETDRMRHHLITRVDTMAAGEAPPLFRKTHERFRAGTPGAEPFPVAATRAAVLIVRDPRDVVCSYGPFFGKETDEAIEDLARSDQRPASPARSRTAQPWGTWSEHCQSWLSPTVPFPVHLVRYESLLSEPVQTLLPVLRAVGMDVEPEALAAAVARTRFDHLRELERTRGFRERSPRSLEFFRRGEAGAWRTELTDDQVLAIEAQHAATMERLGYVCASSEQERAARTAALASRSRDRREHAWELPECLGLEIALGALPEELPDAVRPRPWIQVAPDRTLVSFAGGSRLLVEHGRRAVIEWSPEVPDDGDPGWIVQGWAVTLAMLQRGRLCLHASTVELAGQVVTLAGAPGAGKSTTAVGLRGRGHRLLVDDVTVLDLERDRPVTRPFFRGVHLFPESAEALGIDAAALPQLAGGRSKLAFYAEEPTDEWREIDRVVVLAPSDDQEVSVRHLSGGQRAAALTAHLARRGIAPLTLGEQRCFEMLARLADRVPVTVVSRPRDRWTLDNVMDAIEASAAPDLIDLRAGARGAATSPLDADRV